MKKKLLAAATILVAAIALISAATIITTAQPTLVGKVYTMDNANENNVWQFDRMSDGSLMVSGNFSTMGNGTGTQLDSQGALALSPDGNWLFAVNAGSDNITVFQVTSTGLTVADVVDSHGLMPVSLTIYGNMVYVLNAGTGTVSNNQSTPTPTPNASAAPTVAPTETPTPTPNASTTPTPTATTTPTPTNNTAMNITSPNIAGFTVDQTGQLSFIEGSIQPLSGMNNSAPEQIGFNPNGTMLVVVEKSTNITDVYKVDSMGVAGAPMSTWSVGDAPFGFAFTSTGYLVMSEAASNTMSSFAWTENGSLRTLSGAMPDFGKAPCWVAISSDDKYAYTTNAASGTISTYTISDMGALNLLSSVAAKVTSPALDLAFSQDSQYLYALSGQGIAGFKVFPDGGLWQVANTTGLPSSVTGLATK